MEVSQNRETHVFDLTSRRRRWRREKKKTSFNIHDDVVWREKEFSPRWLGEEFSFFIEQKEK